LLIAAPGDTVVSAQRSTVGLGQRLERAGVPVRVQVLDKLNHATVLATLARPLKWLSPVQDEVLAFLKQAPRS
jgi:acetyl esterase/lipase